MTLKTNETCYILENHQVLLAPFLPLAQEIPVDQQQNLPSQFFIFL